MSDRITHIWTNTTSYLLAVHMQGPRETAAFDDAKTVLTADFAIVIP